MNDLDSVLAQLEEDDPQTGIEAAKDYLAENDTDEENQSQLAYGIAVGYFRQGKHEKASKWLQKTEDDRRFLMLGFNLVEMEKFEEAARAFEKASRSQPTDEDECLLLQAQTLGLAEKYEKAREILDAQLKKELPPDLRSETLLARGTVALETGQTDQARVLFEKVHTDTETNEFKSEATFHLLNIEKESDKIEKAIEYAEWLKENGEQDFWRQAAQEELNKLKQDKQKRQNKLRDYEY